MKIGKEAYLALAQGKLKGLVAVQARVELAPVLVEGARVVHRQLVALLGLDVAVLGAELDADALCFAGRMVRKGRHGEWRDAPGHTLLRSTAHLLSLPPPLTLLPHYHHHHPTLTSFSSGSRSTPSPCLADAVRATRPTMVMKKTLWNMLCVCCVGEGGVEE